MVHPRPQTPQGEPVAKPGTILLIILNLVCKSDIKEALYIVCVYAYVFVCVRVCMYVLGFSHFVLYTTSLVKYTVPIIYTCAVAGLVRSPYDDVIKWKHFPRH